MSSRPNVDSAWKGQRLHPLALGAAVVVLLMGIALPLVMLGANAPGALPYLLLGSLGGLLWAGCAFFWLRPPAATPILVLGLFLSIAVLGNLPTWQIAVPAWLTAELAGSALGAHVRALARRR